MRQSMQARAYASALIVIAVGCLLHFAWEWSGRSAIVALVAATNESTWEHLKLAFWPALALAPIQRRLYGPLPGWLAATAIRCLVPSVVIIALFYGYIAVAGEHHLVADVAIFAIAIVTGEILGHSVLTRAYGPPGRIGSLLLIVVATILFSTLTYRPPACFLFAVPVSSTNGEHTGQP